VGGRCERIVERSPRRRAARHPRLIGNSVPAEAMAANEMEARCPDGPSLPAGPSRAAGPRPPVPAVPAGACGRPQAGTGEKRREEPETSARMRAARHDRSFLPLEGEGAFEDEHRYRRRLLSGAHRRLGVRPLTQLVETRRQNRLPLTENVAACVGVGVVRPTSRLESVPRSTRLPAENRRCHAHQHRQALGHGGRGVPHSAVVSIGPWCAREVG